MQPPRFINQLLDVHRDGHARGDAARDGAGFCSLGNLRSFSEARMNFTQISLDGLLGGATVHALSPHFDRDSTAPVRAEVEREYEQSYGYDQASRITKLSGHGSCGRLEGYFIRLTDCVRPFADKQTLPRLRLPDHAAAARRTWPDVRDNNLPMLFGECAHLHFKPSA